MLERIHPIVPEWTTPESMQHTLSRIMRPKINGYAYVEQSDADDAEEVRMRESLRCYDEDMDIMRWTSGQPDFTDDERRANPRRLSRYKHQSIAT